MPTITFEDSDQPLVSWELEQFLGLFRVTYSHALEIDASPEDIATNPSRYAEIFDRLIPRANLQDFVTELRSTDYETGELRINRIVKTSPLEIAFIGVLSALTLAIIFSGGKVEMTNLKNLKFTLPPLGVGIKNLRAALRFGPPERTRRSERKK